MIAIGIDIGITGAISAIYDDDVAEVRDLPIRMENDGSRRIDVPGLIQILQEFVPEAERADCIGVIENVRVSTMAGHPMSHKTESSLVESRGLVQAALDVVGISTKRVEPMNWKRFYGLIGSSKDDALAMARKLYPSLDGMLKRKKDHNRAESLLIGHFGSRKLA